MPIIVSLWYTETLLKKLEKNISEKIISTKNYPKDRTIVSTQERYSERKLKKTYLLWKIILTKTYANNRITVVHRNVVKRNSKKVSPKKSFPQKIIPKIVSMVYKGKLSTNKNPRKKNSLKNVFTKKSQRSYQWGTQESY